MYNPATSTTLVPAQPVDAGSMERIGLRTIVGLLREASLSIVVCMVILSAAAILYVLRTPPIYYASTKVIIDPGSASLFATEGTNAELLFNEARIDSQVEVIKSERITSAVVRDLNLVDDPEFASREPSLLRRAMAWVEGQHQAEPMVEDEEMRLRYANAALASRMVVRRVGRSFVLEIGFLSMTSERTATIANAIADVYIREQIQSKSEMTIQGSAWLEQRLAPLRNQAYQAMRAVERYKAVGGSGPIGESQVELAELQSVSDVYRRVYEIYLQKFTETAQRISYPVPDARIFSSAVAPLDPIHPKKKLIVGFAAALGAVLGGLLHLFRRALDQRIRSPRQIPQAAGLECLGSVRHVRRMGIRQPSRPVGLRHSGHRPLTLLDSPSELRSIKAALNAAMPGDRPRCIGFVAAAPGEGTTTLAASLALHYAASGARVLLVDSNHLDPAVSRAFADNASCGLMQVLLAPDLLSSAVVPQEVPGLFVLPLGMETGTATPGDRVGATRTVLRPDDHGPKFDLTIFDLPALQVSSEAREIARFLDGIVLVAAQPVTSADRLTAAAETLRLARAVMFGVIVNKLDRASARGAFR